jgi:ribosomal protein S8
MDSVSNFVSLLNQALKTNKFIFYVPYNKINFNISSLLYKENLIYSYQINYLTKKIKISLNKSDDQYSFNRVIRVSKPSKRIYYNSSDVKRKINKENCFYILSTNIGVITSNEAVKKNTFGEVLMEIFF